MALEAMERETVVGWADDLKLAEITTFNRSLITKLKKLSKDYPDTYKLKNEGNVDGSPYVEYEFPKRLVSFRSPTKRKMSDEQKQAASDRMKKMKQDDKKTNKKGKE
jgi:hypothetical protein